MSDKCTTHHYACACREADHAAGIASLKAQLATARAERDAATKRASDLLTRNLAQVRMVREAREKADTAVAAGEKLAEMFYRAKLMGYDRAWADKQIDSIPNPLALAWVKAAQEASNGK